MTSKSSTENLLNYTSRGKILGVILTLFCGCAFLTTCTLVKIYKLHPAEVCFIRGLVQTTVFLLLFVIFKRRGENPKLDYQDDERHVEHFLHKKCVFYGKRVLVVVLCGLSFGCMTGLSYIGVQLIPLSHFVVFGHTTPVFTLGLSALILRYH